MTLTAENISIAAVAAGTAIATITDVWKFKVHNLLTLPLLACGLAFHTWVGGWVGLGFSIAGAACGLSLLITFYILGALGAGDVKLLAALGAWLGVHRTLQVMLVAGVAVGVYSLVLLACRGGIRNAMTQMAIAAYQAKNLTLHLRADVRVEEVAACKDRRRRLIPFAAMVAVGVITVLLQDQFWINWLLAYALK